MSPSKVLTDGDLPDYTIDIINGEQVRKVKVNRPKALCFDYMQLKDMFGLDLETEVISDAVDMLGEDVPSTSKMKPQQEELSF